MNGIILAALSCILTVIPARAQSPSAADANHHLIQSRAVEAMASSIATTDI